MTKYDIVIPVAITDYDFLPKTIRYIHKFLMPERIFIITSSQTKKWLPKKVVNAKNVMVIDEDKLISGLTFNTVSKLIHERSKDFNRVGWLYQQFLKLAFATANVSNNEYYLTWDADTLPLQTINFFDDDNHPYFSMKIEHHQPYFDVIEKLLNIKVYNKQSYIAEHMIFCKSIVTEMLKDISRKANKKDWFSAIIEAIDPKEISCFSEFETYGTYCLNFYPSKYKERYLPAFREAGFIQGRFINEQMLEKLSFDLYMASFELKHFPPFPMKIFFWIYYVYIRLKKYLLT